MPASEPRSFVFSAPSGIVTFGAICVCGSIAYVVASVRDVGPQALIFILGSLFLSIATELLLRTRVRFEGDTLVIRTFGYLGPTKRLLLKKVHDVRFGAVNGEAVIQFGYEQQEERLGPWWGYNRKSLDRNVKAFGGELEEASRRVSQA